MLIHVEYISKIFVGKEIQYKICYFILKTLCTFVQMVFWAKVETILWIIRFTIPSYLSLVINNEVNSDINLVATLIY